MVTSACLPAPPMLGASPSGVGKKVVLVLTLLTLLAVPATADDGPVVAYLLHCQGRVELKRMSWTSFYPASAAVRLLAGDRLRLGADARAVVLCADFVTAPWRPAPGQHSAVEDACMRPKALSQLPDGLAAEIREVERSERVRSPRGLIRDPTPRLRWQSLGADGILPATAQRRLTVASPQTPSPLGLGHETRLRERQKGSGRPAASGSSRSVSGGLPAARPTRAVPASGPDSGSTCFDSSFGRVLSWRDVVGSFPSQSGSRCRVPDRRAAGGEAVRSG